jgi:hypothetical protein
MLEIGFARWEADKVCDKPSDDSCVDRVEPPEGDAVALCSTLNTHRYSPRTIFLLL